MIGWPKNPTEHEWCRDFLLAQHIHVAEDAHILFWTADRKPVWVVAFDSWVGQTCQMHVASDKTRWLPKAFINATYFYAFKVISRKTVFATVNSRNAAIARLIGWLGYKEVHRVHEVHEGGGDLVFMQMDREECRWIKDITWENHPHPLLITKPLPNSRA